MAKTGLFATTAAAAIVAFVAGWAVSGTQAQSGGLAGVARRGFGQKAGGFQSPDQGTRS
jgi:hypothetical protein